MKRFLIETILVAAFVACVNLGAGCASLTPSASQVDSIISSPLVSNQLDAAEDWLDAEIAATEAKLAALAAVVDQEQSAQTNPVDDVESDIPDGTKFLHADVSSWPVTASLSASVSGSTINMPYSKSKVWPANDGVNANPWVFANVGGQWYAATFEWLRYGQTSKPKGVLDGSMGDHIKVSPLSGWEPTSGERIGFMVSGLARSGVRNVKERSNISWVVWP